MNKITIENIKEEPHTVIWYDDVDADILHEEGLYDCHGYYICINGNGKVVATILPPLPRNPTADDVRLLYLYAAHGITVMLTLFVFLPLYSRIFGWW